MRVLRISQDYVPVVTGPVKQASAIAQGLADLGHPNCVFSSNNGAAESMLYRDQEVYPGVYVRRFPVVTRLMGYYVLRGIFKHLWKAQADIIHAHAWRNEASDAALAIARRRNIPAVLHAHGGARAQELAGSTTRQMPYRVYDALFKRNVVAADALVVSTAQEKLECIDYGFPPERIHVIPSGIGVDIWRRATRRRPLDGRKARILLVARLSRDRNVELAIRVAARLKRSGHPFTLRVVGEEVKRSQATRGGYMKELHALARSLSVERDVEFAGLVTGPDLVQEYMDADLFLYPSSYENFGNSVLEAAAAGLPIVATRTGVAPDLIDNGTGGFLIDDPTDVGLAARNVAVLLDNLSRRQVMGAHNRRRALEGYRWDRIALAYEDLYRELIREGIH